jgi:hypothetical protein
MTLLSAELGYPVSFETLPERQFLTRLIEAGVAPGQAELLIAREWAIQAGENERLTDTGRHGIICRTADRTEADHWRSQGQARMRSDLRMTCMTYGLHDIL